ncbi:MAG TPA: glycosyltransferase family 9 protein [Bryobacteraceae bacterium]
MKDVLLVIRLGAMGDVLHTLPAVASLKKSFPEKKIAWLISRKWAPLVAGNPYIDDLISFDRSESASLRRVRGELKALRPAVALDFQGLLQSAIAARLARPARLFGFDRSVAREPLAALLYTDRIRVTGPHRIERNLQLAAAAGARELWQESWIPLGSPEVDLPHGPFVLTSPFAGWGSKQWPLERYGELANRLAREGLPLVANVPPERAGELHPYKDLTVHSSSLAGLIDATRRAAAVVGVDSGPLHLAAALKKPGVALFGPTDPAQTGPFDSPMIVLRQTGVETTYKRGQATHASMSGISVPEVAEALLRSMTRAREVLAAPAGSQ